MAGLVTPMALRVAVTLGLMDRLRAGRAATGSASADSASNVTGAAATTAAASIADPATTVDHLAAELGVNPTALELLLGHLATLGVVERTGTTYRTTDFGALLCEDAGNGLHDLLHHDTAAGRADL